MDKTSQEDLTQHVVEFGDAKELTMGVPAPIYAEDNPQVPGKFEN
ncbi:rubrivinodin family lasso peptide [Roseateles sp. NT4]